MQYLGEEEEDIFISFGFRIQYGRKNLQKKIFLVYFKDILVLFYPTGRYSLLYGERLERMATETHKCCTPKENEAGKNSSSGNKLKKLKTVEFIISLHLLKN